MVAVVFALLPAVPQFLSARSHLQLNPNHDQHRPPRTRRQRNRHLLSKVRDRVFSDKWLALLRKSFPPPRTSLKQGVLPSCDVTRCELEEQEEVSLIDTNIHSLIVVSQSAPPSATPLAASSAAALPPPSSNPSNSRHKLRNTLNARATARTRPRCSRSAWMTTAETCRFVGGTWIS